LNKRFSYGLGFGIEADFSGHAVPYFVMAGYVQKDGQFKIGLLCLVRRGIDGDIPSSDLGERRMGYGARAHGSDASNRTVDDIVRLGGTAKAYVLADIRFRANDLLVRK